MLELDCLALSLGTIELSPVKNQAIFIENSRFAIVEQLIVQTGFPGASGGLLKFGSVVVRSAV